MKIDDPVFGPLEYRGGSWYGVVVLAGVFARAVELRIAGPRRRPPQDLERTVFARLLQDPQTLKLGLERAIITYYQEMVFSVRDDVFSSEEASRLVPVLTHPGQIWTLATAFELRLGFNHEFPEMIFIGFEVSWDEEHGLDVWFLNQTLAVGIEVGHWSDYMQFDLEGKRV